MAPDLLILVKHAKPDVDPAVPAAEWTLGVEGMEGALRLAERLVPLAVQRVVTSVEPKAVETGRIVARQLDVAFQTGHDLHEHLRPDPGYVGQVEFEAKVRRLFDEPQRKVFGAESGEAAATRFGAALDAMAKVYKGTRLCVVAHGTVISLHLERRYGTDGWSTWQALDTPSFVVVDRKSRSVVDVVRSV